MQLRTLTTSHSALIASLLLAVTMLIACGTNGSDPVEAPEPTATTSPPTAAPDETSVGELMEQINTAWDDIESFRVTSTSGPVPVASGSTPTAEGQATIEEWSAPNDRRVVELMDGTVINEQLYVDGTIYMRGLFVGTAVAPEIGSGTWITLDEELVPADTPVGLRVAHLTREPRSPFAEIGSTAPGLASQPVTQSGTVRVGDRRCTLYTFGDPFEDGSEIRYEIALDGDDRPCQVIQRGGGFQNSSIYEFNTGDISIEAPLEGTPVAGTPEG